MKVEKNTATKPAWISPKMSATNRFQSTAAKLPDRRNFPQLRTDVDTQGEKHHWSLHRSFIDPSLIPSSILHRPFIDPSLIPSSILHHSFIDTSSTLHWSIHRSFIDPWVCDCACVCVCVKNVHFELEICVPRAQRTHGTAARSAEDARHCSQSASHEHF